MTHFVFGAKTRLGRHLLGGLAGENVILLARDQQEALLLREAHPAVISLDEGKLVWPVEHHDVVIHVLALGPIHPGGGKGLQAEQKKVQIELAGVRAILDEYPMARKKIIFVSTALVFAPRAERAAYVGWKLLLESELREMLTGDKASVFLGFYPGRLTESRSLSKPSHWLATGYKPFAQKLIRATHGSQNHQRLIGLDAVGLLVFSAFRRLLNFRS